MLILFWNQLIMLLAECTKTLLVAYKSATSVYIELMQSQHCHQTHRHWLKLKKQKGFLCLKWLVIFILSLSREKIDPHAIYIVSLVGLIWSYITLVACPALEKTGQATSPVYCMATPTSSSSSFDLLSLTFSHYYTSPIIHTQRLVSYLLAP